MKISFSDLLRGFGVSSLREMSTVCFAHVDSIHIDELFSIGRFEWLLNQPGVFRNLRLNKDHVDINPYNVNREGSIRIMQLLSHLYTGATCILHNAESRDYELHRICHEAESNHRVPINCNVYLTPIGEKAFPPHTDPHDVLIVQIAGAKRWYIKHEGGIGTEYTMRKGNVLFVPSGVQHNAVTIDSEDTFSLHLTFGIFKPYLSTIVPHFVRQFEGTEQNHSYNIFKCTGVDSDEEGMEVLTDMLSVVSAELGDSFIGNRDFIKQALFRVRAELIDKMKYTFDGALESLLKYRGEKGISHQTKLRVTSNPFCLKQSEQSTLIYTSHTSTILPFPYALVNTILSRSESFTIDDLQTDCDKDLLMLICNLLLKRSILLLSL
jgi:mannose-6-phosphate isomerase-like protein (cupin superfamily)